jgi:hypothetical protein
MLRCIQVECYRFDERMENVNLTAQLDAMFSFGEKRVLDMVYTR